MIYREISLPTGQILRVIEPSEEYEYITDGDTYASIAYLGDGADVSTWHDTNDEPLEADESDFAQLGREVLNDD